MPAGVEEFGAFSGDLHPHNDEFAPGFSAFTQNLPPKGIGTEKSF
jgi:hypothetical protein